MPHIVLLGDSVFDNCRYVPLGYDVEHQLRRLLGSDWACDVLAEDGATTCGIVDQLAKVPSSATHLVLSVGGNDALALLGLLDTPVKSSQQAFELLFAAVEKFSYDYRQAVRRCLRLDKPMIICTIYQGNFSDERVKQTTSVALTAFNDAIYRAAGDYDISVMELRSVCDDASDFVEMIEPSRTGGKKIAQAIANAVKSQFKSNVAVLR